MILFIYKKRPFYEKSLNWLSFIEEILFLLATGVLFALGKVENEENAINLAYFVVLFLGIIFALEIIFLLKEVVFLIWDAFSFLYSKIRTKNRI